MATGQANQPANPNPSALTTEPRAVWGRPLAVAAAIVFFISLAFPVVAGSEKHRVLPQVVGHARCWLSLCPCDPGVRNYRAHSGNRGPASRGRQLPNLSGYEQWNTRASVVVMLFGDRIIWLNCVTGFMWRTWLLVYCLPWWFTALRSSVSKSK